MLAPIPLNGACWRIMDTFNIADFYDIGQRMTAIAHTISLGGGRDYLFHRDNSGAIVEKLLELRGHCESLGLAFSLKQIDLLVTQLQGKPGDIVGIWTKDLRPKVVTIQQGIKHELEMHVFLKIRPDLIEYYQRPNLFGDQVATAFSKVSKEIEEAGKCLALGRNTACVFHLMRVMEAGVRALGQSLGNPSLDPSKNPNWGQILGPCNDELRKAKPKRSPAWQASDVFFSEATANLLAVKDAWRNPTMHIERSYDGEEARDVFSSVRAFMRHLATELTE